MVKLEDYRVHVKMEVAWGDMDAQGIVNSTQYLKYFETARLKYYERLKIAFFDGDTRPTLARISCKYLAPVSYPDKLTIGVRIKSMGKSSMVFEHAVFNKSIGLCAVGESVIVAVDTSTLKKTSISEKMRTAIAKQEGETL